jgi:hypothetical protein
MSHFYASMKGARGQATRCGSKQSGIFAHIRGWNFGVRVELVHVGGKDAVRLYQTSGTNGGKEWKIGAWTEDEMPACEMPLANRPQK